MKKKSRPKIIIRKVSEVPPAPQAPPEEWKKEIIENQKAAREKLDSVMDHTVMLPDAAEQIQKGMNDLTEKYGKLIKLYDMMTEYKKQNSLMILSLSKIFERIVQLRLFCEGSVSGETEFNAELLKKANGTERFMKMELNSFGIVPIFPLHNEEFNPEQQESLTTVEPESESDLPGHVAECINMGIIQNGIVIKYAQVSVYKAKAKGQSEPATEENF